MCLSLTTAWASDNPIEELITDEAGKAAEEARESVVKQTDPAGILSEIEEPLAEQEVEIELSSATESAIDLSFPEEENKLQLPTFDGVSSGSCGDGLTWTLDNAGMLTISGTGRMDVFGEFHETPWSKQDVLSVTIADGVTSIGGSAFCNCTALTSVSIPDSVVGIGEWAFCNCTALTSVSIPDSVVSIGKDAFKGTPWYTDWLNAPEQTEFAIAGGVLLRYRGTGGNVAIPVGVKSIGRDAFSCCYDLKSVVIPDSTESIEPGAFYNCSSLESVMIGEGLRTLGIVKWSYRGDEDSGAFEGCVNLKSITLPGSLKVIGSWTFERCEALTEILYQGSRADWKNIEIGKDALNEGMVRFLVSDKPADKDGDGNVTVLDAAAWLGGSKPEMATLALREVVGIQG